MMTCKCIRCGKKFISEKYAKICQLCYFFKEDTEYTNSLKRQNDVTKNDIP